jgi:hypothetical protein
MSQTKTTNEHIGKNEYIFILVIKYLSFHHLEKPYDGMDNADTEIAEVSQRFLLMLSNFFFII